MRKCVGRFPGEVGRAKVDRRGVCRYTILPRTKVGSWRNGRWSCNLKSMSAGDFRSPAAWGRPRAVASSSRFIKLAELRRLRGTEQVAAVCYRVRNSGVEFLLVQTRGGHWTFPKGKVEGGITQAQAAALEAFEEAGVHGRMEELSFTQYIRRKGRATGKANRHARSNPIGNSLEIVMNAYLCEVVRLTPPQESGRMPTWFSVEKPSGDCARIGTRSSATNWCALSKKRRRGFSARTGAARRWPWCGGRDSALLRRRGGSHAATRACTIGQDALDSAKTQLLPCGFN